MSISIATRGMFQSCCGISGGAGAPPFRKDYPDIIKPRIVVTTVHEKSGKSFNAIENISVRLLDSTEE